MAKSTAKPMNCPREFARSASVHPLAGVALDVRANGTPLPCANDLIDLLNTTQAIAYGIEAVTRALINDEAANDAGEPAMLDKTTTDALQGLVAAAARTLAEQAARISDAIQEAAARQQCIEAGQ